MHIGLLLFPNLTQLDLTGPHAVFARMPDTTVHLVWKNREPVASGAPGLGLSILPTTTFAECPPLDVICVPGGPGQLEIMDDQEPLDFLRRQSVQAKWITSVCTGSLILGAAGLLKGYRATCHWASLDQLSLFGAEPVPERVVIDRNRATGGGVTAGIDFALTLAARMHGEDTAKAIQLGMEYDPAPPFASGSPRTADPALVARLRRQMAPWLAQRHAVNLRAAGRLNRPASPGA